MPSITFLRHSRALANGQGIMMGSGLDSPLSDEGIAIARAKGIELHGANFQPNRVYTSRLLRAKQTAQLILEGINSSVTPVELADLNERDFGKYDGKPYQEALDAFAAEGDNPATVETTDHFIARISAALEQIKAETDDTTLVVTHSNPVMVLQCLLLHTYDVKEFGKIGDPAYCSGFTYTF